jgi:hypothetical protein
VIESYDFGVIKIAGGIYRSDVIIYPDHVDSQWWRKQGHLLEMNDIKEVIETKPDVIIIGTGQSGYMHVSDNTLAKIHKLNIETIVMPTEKACKEYNRIASKKKVIACLHLTC